MRTRLRLLLVPTLFTLAACIVLVGLGNWQLRRLAWKEGLIAAAAARPHMAVEDVPPAARWTGLDVDPLTYRPFRLRGHFLFNKDARVFTSLPDPTGPYGGPGFWIITPFVLDDGGTVLVNRGFVTSEQREVTDRSETPTGEVTVTGLLRPDDARGLFTPDDTPAKNIFFTRQIGTIAAAKELQGPIAPFGIDLLASETPPGGRPEAGQTRMIFPNSHLQYALTWYGLAIGLLAVYAGFVRKRLTIPPAPA